MSNLPESITDASTVEEMAEAFHPDNLGGRNWHRYAVLDVVEAALLWAAGSASRDDFLSALSDSPIMVDAIWGEINEKPPEER